MFLAVWVTLGLLQLWLPGSLQLSVLTNAEWSKLSQMESARELVREAKCLSYCLHKFSSFVFRVYPNETEATCTNQRCEKAIGSNDCKKSCAYMCMIYDYKQVFKEANDITVQSKISPEDVTLTWTEPTAFTGLTPVYLVYIRHNDALVGELKKVLLSRQFKQTVEELCQVSKHAKSHEHEYYFRVLAVSGDKQDNSICVSPEHEVELQKPKVVKDFHVIKKRFPEYLDRPPLPTKWPGDKIRLPLRWTPDMAESPSIDGYRVIVWYGKETSKAVSQTDLRVIQCTSSFIPGLNPKSLPGTPKPNSPTTSKPPPPEVDANGVISVQNCSDIHYQIYLHEETAKDTVFTISVSAMFGCSVGPAATTEYRYEGCRQVTSYPTEKCDIQEKPPKSVPATRGIERFKVTAPGNASVGSIVKVKTTWGPPAYKYGHVRSYRVVWDAKGRFVNQSVTTEASFSFSFEMRNPKEQVEIKITPQFFNSLIEGTQTNHLIALPYIPPMHPPPPGGTRGLTLEGQIGIGVGVGLLVIITLLVIVVVVFLRRNKRSKKARDTLCERSLNSLETKIELTDNGSKDEQFTSKVHSVKTDEWEIDVNALRILGELGQGAFGKVFKGMLSGWETTSAETSQGSTKSTSTGSSGGKEKEKIVAVKTLHNPDDVDQKREFFEEIEMMKSVGYHRNIVNLIGCCTVTEPLCLIQEFVPCGDLLHYLRARRAVMLKAKMQEDGYLRPWDVVDHLREEESRFSTGSIRSSTQLVRNENSAGSISLKEAVSATIPEIPLSAADLMSFAWQISCGMEYISAKGLIHRDLAARNILVGEKKTVKIADFGLTRKINDEHMYVTRKSKRLPLKWMAPEAIFDKVFTTQTDVWAYGVLLWEIATLGGSPYPLISNSNLLQRLKEGYRMERPEHCSDELYAVMTECWRESPDERPTFNRIREELEEVMERDTPYLELENMDPNSSYYTVMSGSSDTLNSQDTAL